MTPEEQYERSMEYASLGLLRAKVDVLLRLANDTNDLAFSEAFEGASDAFERIRSLPSIAHASGIALALAADLRRIADEIRSDTEDDGDEDLEVSEWAEWLEDRCAWGLAESEPPRPGYRRLVSGGWIPEGMAVPLGEQLRQ